MIPSQPIDELISDQGYKLEHALYHNELVPFVISYIYKPNKITRGFLVLNIIFLLHLVLTIVCFLINGGAFSVAVVAFLKGCIITIVLIPPHEFLHGVAYKLCGAESVTYKANWRKLYFMAVADKFLTGRRCFYFIGLTPFAVISLALLFFSIFASHEWRITCLSALTIHATMCLGDFGLMSYFAENKHKEIVTYDDVENSVSYFYSKEKSETNTGQ